MTIPSEVSNKMQSTLPGRDLANNYLYHDDDWCHMCSKGEYGMCKLDETDQNGMISESIQNTPIAPMKYTR